MSARRATSNGGGGFSSCWDRMPPNRARDAERRPRIRSRELSGSASCHLFCWWHLAEQTEEILGGLTRNLFERDPAGLRQHLGNFDHIGRLVALAAKFARRQIRRVGLDHDAIGRKLGRKVAQGLRFLEGQNARERNRKPQRDRLHRQLSPAGIAMQHRAKRSFCRFVWEDTAAIIVGVAGVNDQRETGGSGGRDVGAKAALLRLR